MSKNGSDGDLGKVMVVYGSFLDEDYSDGSQPDTTVIVGKSKMVV